jgi:hypothetical protein
MSMRRVGVLVLSGALPVLATLMLALPGCGGGGGQTTGASGETKIAPPVNPAPGSVPVEDEYKTQKK